MRKPRSSSRGVKVLTALLAPLPEKREEFLQTIRLLNTEIRKEPGCLECVIGRELEEGSRFLLFMVWADQQALEAHIESEHFRILHGAASVLSSSTDFQFIAANATLAE
jgi:quinol monooxygenase YgiN